MKRTPEVVPGKRLTLGQANAYLSLRAKGGQWAGRRELSVMQSSLDALVQHGLAERRRVGYVDQWRVAGK